MSTKPVTPVGATPTVAAAGGSSRQRRIDLGYRFVPRYRIVCVAILVLIALAAITAPDVFHEGSVQFITALAGVLAIASLGQGLVVMTGGIDLSVPSVMTLGGVVMVKVGNESNGDLVPAILVCLGLALAIGLVNGLLVVFGKINSLITTLAMSVFIAGATTWWAGNGFSASGKVPPAVLDISSSYVGPISALTLVGLGLTLILAFVLRSSGVGRAFVATGANRRAAEIIGVRVRFYEIGAYAAAAVLYMTAGVLLGGVLQTPDYTLGAPYQLTTIVAVALAGALLSGGPSSLLCIAGAAIFVPLLQQYLRVEGYSAGVQQLVNGAILVIAVALVTSGLLGRGSPLRGLRSLLRGS